MTHPKCRKLKQNVSSLASFFAVAGGGFLYLSNDLIGSFNGLCVMVVDMVFARDGLLKAGSN